MPRIASRADENVLRRYGFGRIAGVDEAGRGCLAGPVAAGAVVLDVRRHIPGLSDSKLLTAAEREGLYDQIVRHAAGWAVALVEPSIIDAINIHRASFQAMRLAIHGLAPLPDCVIVDGFRIPELILPQRRIIGGDRRCAAIAAASIIAKVTRDRLMLTLHGQDPRYGFDKHKGYGTAEHLAAVSKYGYSSVHRRSFRPPSLFDTMHAPAEVEATGDAIDNDGLA
jgi:ribonuclease HII